MKFSNYMDTDYRGDILLNLRSNTVTVITHAVII